jgi:hypothetical protein
MSGIVLDLLSNEAVAWAIIKLSSLYRYAGVFV